MGWWLESVNFFTKSPYLDQIFSLGGRRGGEGERWGGGWNEARVGKFILQRIQIKKYIYTFLEGVGGGVGRG